MALIDNVHYNIIKISEDQNMDQTNIGLFPNSNTDKDNNNLQKNSSAYKEICLDYYYNLSLYNKEGLIKKTEMDYPYYPNVENGDTFYSDIIKFLKSTIKYLKNETIEKTWPTHINSINDYKEKENKKRYFRKKVNKYFYYNHNLYIIRNKKNFETNNKILSLLALNKIDDVDDF